MNRNKFTVCALLLSLLCLSVVSISAWAQGTRSAKPLIFSQGAEPRGLDPAYVDDGESAKIMVNIYDTLVRYAPDSTELRPGLADSWSSNEGGTVWIFHLRQGVKFHDGTPLTAEAVKFSVERQLPPNRTNDMPYASFTFGPVDRIDALDDYTVRFQLKEPYAPFLANLAMAVAAPIVSPTSVARYGTDFIEHPVGTGPFRFVRWDKGQQIVLERNDAYWDGTPAVQKVIFQFRRDNAVRAGELLVGDAHIIDGVSPTMINMLENNGIHIISAPGMNINYFGFISDRPPFDNVNVRKAISMAIDRDKLVTYLYQGMVELAEGPLPPFMRGSAARSHPYEYNPEKARQLLAEAGYSNGLSFTILAYPNPRPYNPIGGERLATAIQGDLQKIGIQTEIQIVPWKDYRKAVFDGQGSAFVYGWTGDNGDWDNFLSLFESKEIERTLNKAKYSNTEVDRLLERGRRTSDAVERKEIYSAVEELIVADAPWVFLSHSQILVAHRPEVKGLVVHPTGVVFLKNVEY